MEAHKVCAIHVPRKVPTFTEHEWHLKEIITHYVFRSTFHTTNICFVIFNVICSKQFFVLKGKYLVCFKISRCLLHVESSQSFGEV